MFLERDQCIIQILQAIGWIINAEAETNKELHLIAVKLVSSKYCLYLCRVRSLVVWPERETYSSWSCSKTWSWWSSATLCFYIDTEMILCNSLRSSRSPCRTWVWAWFTHLISMRWIQTLKEEVPELTSYRRSITKDLGKISPSPP